MVRHRDVGRGVAAACVVMGLLLAIPATSFGAEGPAGFVVHGKPLPLPEIAFEAGDGERMSLADFRGRVVLLNLWATWCAPCRREMPTLDRLQAQLGGPQFEVVALSIDRAGLPAVKPFYEELGLTALSIYVDRSGKAQRALDALGIPTTVLIDREGNEVGRLLGPAEWDSPEMVEFIRGFLEERPRAARPSLPVTGGSHMSLRT